MNEKQARTLTYLKTKYPVKFKKISKSEISADTLKRMEDWSLLFKKDNTNAIFYEGTNSVLREQGILRNNGYASMIQVLERF